MALQTYAYYRSKNSLSGEGFVNGVQLALYTTDPALAPSDTEAERKALVATAVSNLVGGSYEADDFATELALGPSAGMGMATDGDLVVVGDFGVSVSIT